MDVIVIGNVEPIHVARKRGIWKSREAALAELKSLREKLPQRLLGKRAVLVNYETEYRSEDYDLAVGIEITGSVPQDCGCEEAWIRFPEEAASLVCRKRGTNPGNPEQNRESTVRQSVETTREQLAQSEGLEQGRQACGNAAAETALGYQQLLRGLEERSIQIVGACCEIFYEDGTIELKVPVHRLNEPGARTNESEVRQTNEPEVKNKQQNINTAPTFTDDPQAIGRWQLLDVVPSAEQFCYGNYKSAQIGWLKELYFLPGGQPYWIVDGWTKGALFTSSGYPKHRYRHDYTIREENGKRLMFLAIRETHLEDRGGNPQIWVFEQVSGKAYRKEEIRIRDQVDMPFVPDKTAYGDWIARDFVTLPEDFDPEHQHFPTEGLFFRKISLAEDGTALAQYGDSDYRLNWTKGYLLDRKNELAEEYRLKALGGKEYLFVQWKSGDYSFGGRTPSWYVFAKE